MPWTELAIRTRREEWRLLEPALDETGALAVTLADAHDDAIFEPPPGETPLWPELIATALYDVDVDQRGLVASLQAIVSGLDEARMTFRHVADADWERAWLDQFGPMRFGERLWIYPSTIDPPDDPDTVVVRLDPGLAFGTGTHATTALCLQWLDAQDLTGRTVLDYGSGSGVLAIAALKLGALRAIAVDTDPQALIASADNAERNGVADALIVCAPGDPRIVACDVVVANILAGALISLAPQILALAEPGAPIALSGVLREQADEVAAAYAAQCEALVVDAREDWVRISGKRHR